MLRGLKAAERGARLELYDRYATHVRRVITRVIGPDRELDDLVHEVFIGAYRSVGGVRDPAKLKSWLTSVTVFTARGCIRRRSRKKWLSFSDPDELPRITAPVADPEVREALDHTYAVLEQMPADLRIPFALRFIDKMELTETAQACGVSLATVKRRLNKAEHRFVTLARTRPNLVPWIQQHPRWRNL